MVPEKKRVAPKYPLFSRPPPGKALAVSRNGVRYEASSVRETSGITGMSGVVVAVDEKTGRELWEQKIYSIKYIPDLETDVQEVYITRLYFPLLSKALRVENERKAVFELNLETREVKKIR